MGGNEKASDFIREIVKEDLASGRFTKVITRFPPEPNAYLHIGHAKAIWVDYGVASDFRGKFNLRFDDTNPLKEEQEFVDGIIEDMAWVLSPATNGADGSSVWNGSALFASDYFEQMLEWAVDLIKRDRAYVCDLSPDEMRATRGTLTTPGTASPGRNRTPEENLTLFDQMVAGEFPDGTKTLRAKIDMASPNINLRDPVMYRIRHAHHHRQGHKWCVYPSYDWAHGLEDSIESVSHSLCTLEYEIHRPLYDWFLSELGIFHSRQIEFSRLNLTHTVMSKRKFVELVQGGFVGGYDDPRMPTLAGLRRRGYAPEVIREFCKRIGVTKADTNIEMYQLEDCAREELNKRALRVMGVIDPLKVVITNLPEGHFEEMDAVNNPEDETAGKRKIPFSKVIYIEKEDFKEVPPPKYYRLSPGTEVRLRYSYVMKCVDVVKDANGEVTEIHCEIDPETKGANPSDGRKIKSTIHWVSAEHAINAEVRLYDHLFSVPNPDGAATDGKTYLDFVNQDSARTIGAFIEPSVKGAMPGTSYQFERVGYFCVDLDSTDSNLVFNRTVTLRDTWAKIENATKK